MTSCFVQARGTIELYFYGELDEHLRAETERHLSTCAECRLALNELAVIRAALATRPDVSAPEGGDWTRFMTRLDGAIRSGVRGKADTSDPASRVTIEPVRQRHPVAYVLMAALLALVTVSVAHIVRSRFAVDDEIADIARSDAPSATWTDDAAFASLSEQHFDRAKLVVLGLANKKAAEGVPAEWQYERELASTLLADTRLYRLAAEDRGMKQIARIMGDLELVLLQASLSHDLQPETLAQIQRLIRTRDLVTKMNVVASAGM